MNPPDPDHDPARGAAASPLPPDVGDVVLIVDDVPDNLAVLHDALDESGYTVLVATSGEAALALAAKAPPDIVLLDAVMPGLNGFEVARRLKADPATAAVPIIFMTGLTETEHVLEGFGAGGADYVTKPIRPREVLARIAAHLNNARSQRQARQALDAFGHATLVVRDGDDRRIWQTALARELLGRYFADLPEHQAPPELMAWVGRQAIRQRAGAEPQTLTISRGAGRLTCALHPLEDAGASDGQWLIVLREASEAAMLAAWVQAFTLTTREAEVLYWVIQGKTNRDIGDIIGASPATVKKHLERVYDKLGVETRTAAASLAMSRARG
jgi:DNA-binding response OmpR family regulator/DNA-binding CsgD family transcriptional regulator